MTSSDRVVLHNGVLIPPQLIANVAAWSQDELTPGWIASLPATVAHLCEKWQIDLDPIVPRSNVTLVLFGNSAELGPAVIKSSPLADEFRAEATALRLATSDNVSRLYDVDFHRGAMVIERIVPGTPLKHVAMTDEEATRLAAETVMTFWRSVPDPTGLHPLRYWARDLLIWQSRPDLIPDHLITRAQELADYRLSHQTRQVLLHGDFHHDNLLRRENGDWAIIDPKGLIGDPAFEVVTWMWNPAAVDTRDDFVQLTSRRIDIFSEVWNIDRQELLEWGFLGAVLSVCWYGKMPESVEGGRDGALRTARALESLL